MVLADRGANRMIDKKDYFIVATHYTVSCALNELSAVLMAIDKGFPRETAKETIHKVKDNLEDLLHAAEQVLEPTEDA